MAARAGRGRCYLLRIGVTQLIVAVLVVVLGEVHSRRQFRRLQRLVNEDPPQEGKSDA